MAWSNRHKMPGIPAILLIALIIPVSAVSFNPEGGTFTDPVEITINSTIEAWTDIQPDDGTLPIYRWRFNPAVFEIVSGDDRSRNVTFRAIKETKKPEAISYGNKDCSDNDGKDSPCSASEKAPQKYWHIIRISPPVAGLSVTQAGNDRSGSVRFTDLSTGSPSSWSWDFGDGWGSAEQNPEHTYEKSGKYTVTLRTANMGGEDMATTTVDIEVKEPEENAVSPVTDATSPSGVVLASIYPSGTVSVVHFNTTGAVIDDTGRSWVPTSLSYSNTVYKFGGGSALFNGAAWIYTNDDPAFSPGSENFTFSAWVYPTTSLTGYGEVWGNWWTNQGGTSLDFSGGVPRIVYDNSGTTKIISGTRSLPLNTWSNVVLQGKTVSGASDVTLYVNGVPNGTITGAYNIRKPVSQTRFYIGRASTAHILLQAGTYVDDFFAVKGGPAIYTEPFTPPLHEFGFTQQQTQFTVYAEAGELGEIYTIAKGFWDQMIIAENGDIEWNDWQGESDIISATDACESHWNSTTNADDWIENADFAYFSGHGNQNLIAFQNYDENSGLNYINADSMRLGSGRLKWAVFDSCESLNYTSWTNWQQSFTGLHMLLGMNTSTVPSFDEYGDSRGFVFARLMRGDYWQNATTSLKIIDAWDWAGRYTWSEEPGHSSFDVFTGVVYDTNCLNDYLPGWGSSCTATSGSQGYHSTLIFAQYPPLGKSDTNYNLLDLANGKYSISGSVPAKEVITVYSSKKPEYNRNWADLLARNLGMSGKTSETVNAFNLDGSDAENYYFVVQKDAPVISFQKIDARSGFPQSRGESVSAANTFLTENGLMSSDALEPCVSYNSGESVSRSGERTVDWRTAVVTYSRELDGLPVWNSQKMVELDSQGKVIGYFQNWRDYKPYKKFKLKSLEKAFAEFQAKQDFSDKSKADKIVVTDVQLGYYSQPAVATEKFLQPIYVFDGYLQYGDSIEPFAPVAISATDEVFNEIP